MAKRVGIKGYTNDSILVYYGLQAFCIHDFGNRNAKLTIKRIKLDIRDRRTMSLGELLSITTKHGAKISSTRGQR